MIYTVTLNPAVDYTVHLHSFQSGSLNRSSYESVHYGGKGINVSTVLTALGIPNIALGFIAGFTGEALERSMSEQGIQTRFIRLDQGMTRINVKIKADQESEINGRGPDIDSSSREQFLMNLRVLQPQDYLILSGSIPPSLDADFYSVIMDKVNPLVKLIVDADGPALLHTLPHRPFLIKPNRRELECVLGRPCPTLDEVVQGAVSLIDQGALNVLVSLGPEGALMVNSAKQSFHLPAIPGQAVDTVGAGDSMVAGFLWGWLESEDLLTAARRGVLCGCAAAFNYGLANRQSIEELAQTQKIRGSL